MNDTENLETDCVIPCDCCGTPAPLLNEDLHRCQDCETAGALPDWGGLLWAPGQVDWVEL